MPDFQGGRFPPDPPARAFWRYRVMVVVIVMVGVMDGIVVMVGGMDGVRLFR